MATRALRILPNILSASRLVLAGAFVAADGATARLVIVLVAGLTDFLDGFVARRVNATSRWGALFDPVTDRVFALAAVATLLFDGLLTVPQYFVLIARDLATAAGFVVAKAMPTLRPATFQARWTGKTVTGLQFAALVSALVAREALPLLIVLVALASAASIIDYTVSLWRARTPLTVVVLVAALHAGAPALSAQVWTPRATPRDTTTLRPELRLDYLGGPTQGLHAGVGLSARAGTYLRVGANAGAGPDVFGDGSDRAHADVTARFMLDPFRQSRLGLSVGGGVSARYHRDRVRAFALLVADVEAGRNTGWMPFARAGLGGGARLTIGLRRAGAIGR